MFAGWKKFTQIELVKQLLFKKGSVIAGAIRFDQTLRPLFAQATPAAKTVTTTLTAAELLTGIITGNQGGGAAASYTLPLAADLEKALQALLGALPAAGNQSFDFSVINISTVVAEDITVVTNTGWTLVGNMVVQEGAAATGSLSTALFRARRTAANTFTLYRIA